MWLHGKFLKKLCNLVSALMHRTRKILYLPLFLFLSPSLFLSFSLSDSSSLSLSLPSLPPTHPPFISLSLSLSLSLSKPRHLSTSTQWLSYTDPARFSLPIFCVCVRALSLSLSRPWHQPSGSHWQHPEDFGGFGGSLPHHVSSLCSLAQSPQTLWAFLQKTRVCVYECMWDSGCVCARAFGCVCLCACVCVCVCVRARACAFVFVRVFASLSLCVCVCARAACCRRVGKRTMILGKFWNFGRERELIRDYPVPDR